MVLFEMFCSAHPLPYPSVVSWSMTLIPDFGSVVLGVPEPELSWSMPPPFNVLKVTVDAWSKPDNHKALSAPSSTPLELSVG